MKILKGICLLNMEMIIRKAVSEELDTVYDIYCYAKHFMEEHGNDKQWTGEDAVTWQGVELLINNGNLYVGVEEGRIQFVFAYFLGEDKTYTVIEDGQWLNNEPYGAVHRVASAGTKKGVVRIIRDWALEQLPNLKIDTHHDNIVMQKALANAGFTKCGIIHLMNGEPRIAYQICR